MKAKRKRKLITTIHCHCGHAWTAVFRSGILRLKTNCPSCRQKIYTRSGQAVTGPVCRGCHRPRPNLKEPCVFCRHK